MQISVPNANRLWLAVFALIVGLVIFVYDDYGITHDEPIQNRYGNTVRDYYNSGFQDKTACSYHNVYLYGGAFDGLAAVLTHHSSLGEYETRHLFNGLIGALGILATWKIGRLMGGSWAGLISALILFLTPTWMGHMYNNPKDIPFATGYAWTMYYLLLSMERFPLLPPSLIARFGIALGLTLGVRIGGGLLVMYMLLAAGLYVIAPKLFSRDGADVAPLWKRLAFPALSGVGVMLLAWGIMLVAWPFAQQSPLKNPMVALERMSKFVDWPGTNLIAGKYIDVMTMPKSYLLHYLAVKMPPLTFVGLALGLIALVVAIRRGQLRRLHLQTTRWFLILFGMVFPAIYAVAKDSILYDEIRHFSFIFPLLSVFAGCGAAACWLLAGNARMRNGLALLLTTVALYQGSVLVRLHPYQYVYYNALAGGVAGADGRYETDYWAHSYKEAVRFIEDHARARDGAAFACRQYQIYVDGPYLSATYYFPTNFARTENRAGADFQMTHTRWELHTNLTGRAIGSIHRLGAHLTYITERDQ